MATKPTETYVSRIRAIDTLYTGGPIPATATKIMRLDAAIREGYFVDSPLGTFTIDAQDVNFHDNRSDQWGAWVELGSFTGAVDAHLVETDLNGESTIAKLNVPGNLLGTTSLTVSTTTATQSATFSGGSTDCVLMTSTNADGGLRVTTLGDAGTTVDLVAFINIGGVGSGRALIGVSDGTCAATFISNDTTSAARSLEGVVIGQGAAVFGQAVDGHGLLAEATGTGAPLRLIPRSGDPSGATGSLVGGVWVDDNSVVDAFRVILNTAPVYLHTSSRKFTYAATNSASGALGFPGEQDFDMTISATALPDKSMDVWLVFSAVFEQTAVSPPSRNYGELLFSDQDEGPLLIETIELYTDPAISNEKLPFYARIFYTIPAAGALPATSVRTLRVKVRVLNSAAITWSNLTFSMETKHD